MGYRLAAAEQLTTGHPSSGARLLRPLVKGGPIRFLKLLKLSLMGSPDLRGRQVELRHMILSLDKITRLIFSYAKSNLKSSTSPVSIASEEAAVLVGLKKEAAILPTGIRGGHCSVVPSATRPRSGNGRNYKAPRLREAEKTFEDLASGDEGPRPTSESRRLGINAPFLWRTPLVILGTSNSLLK